MHFKSINDLSVDLVKNLHRFHGSIDLIVGIPRSGMLPATMLALYLNKDLVDIESYLKGKVFSRGTTRLTNSISEHDAKKIVIVDDSVGSGGTITAIKEKLKNSKDNIIYFSPYVTRKNKHLVDVYFEILPIPRAFEWNLLHHPMLKDCCLDFDGVLCEDPKYKENDDGIRYKKFLLNAKPRFMAAHSHAYTIRHDHRDSHCFFCLILAFPDRSHTERNPSPVKKYIPRITDPHISSCDIL